MDRLLLIAVIAFALAVTSSGAWNARRNADTGDQEDDQSRMNADTDDNEEDQSQRYADTEDKEDDQSRRNADIDDDEDDQSIRDDKDDQEDDQFERNADTDSDTDKEDDQMRMLVDTRDHLGEMRQLNEELRQNGWARARTSSQRPQKGRL